MAEQYSLIIIGGGMTGLSAGLAWVINNDPRQQPVLILEKQPLPGGYVTTYTRRGYAFDTCQMISNLAPVFKYFGLDLDMKPFAGTLCRVFLADTRAGKTRVLDLPAGWDAFEAHMSKTFPGEAGKIHRFLRYSRAMYQEMRFLKTVPTLWDMLGIALRCPKTIRHVAQTFDRYLEKFAVQSDDFLEILRVFVIMAGLPESQVAAFLPVGVMCSLLEGAMRPSRAFGDLPQKMAARFTALGGTLRLNATVEKIMVANNRVQGVRLKGGEIIAAERIISAVNTQQAMASLVGLDVLHNADPTYARKAAGVSMTASTLNVSLGLDPTWQPDLAEGYHVLTTGGDTLNILFRASQQGGNAYSESCFHFSVTYSLANPAKPTLTLSLFPMAMGQWMHWRNEDRTRYQMEKQRWADYAIAVTERYMLPGLAGHVHATDVSTPATYARYSGADNGSIYDMVSDPANFGLRRLGMQTAIHGLLHPKFAHGVFGSMMGGLQAVDALMKKRIMGGNAQFRPLKGMRA